jgi:mannose/cellobiose epimerase-like protein (N-acyl-D-glucosamine 2-epimerase family)
VTPTPAELRRHWFDELLPAWAERGVDRQRGGFHDRLGADLEPLPDDHRRLLVQARQIWVFAHSASCGGPSFCAGVARSGFEFLRARYLDRRGGGWFLTVGLDGEPRDRTKDLYAHAFVILALSALHRATGDAEPLRLAHDTLRWIESRLEDREHGGFFDAVEPDGRRRTEPRGQNPHMHLLEALLALADASGERVHLARAGRIADLALARFVDARTGGLGEHFARDWSPAAGPAGERVEPGHCFEWSWLLRALSRAEPGRPLAGEADRLFGFALDCGVDAASGGVRDSVDREGRPLEETQRLWPQTERVQAYAARFADARRPEDAEGLRAALGHCLERWVRPDRRAWHERLDRSGRPVVYEHPATSLYHVVGALSDACDALAGERVAPRSRAGPSG